MLDQVELEQEATIEFIIMKTICQMINHNDSLLVQSHHVGSLFFLLTIKYKSCGSSFTYDVSLVHSLLKISPSYMNEWDIAIPFTDPELFNKTIDYLQTDCGYHI